MQHYTLNIGLQVASAIIGLQVASAIKLPNYIIGSVY